MDYGMDKVKRFISAYFPIFLILVLSFLVIFSLYHYINLDNLKLYQKTLTLFVNQHPILALLAYCIIYITVIGLLIPVATIMTLAGGILFGQWIGTLAVVLCATLGATLFFMGAKMASRKWITQKAGAWINKMKAGFHENAFFYLLTLRFIPIFPFFAINIAAAFFQIPLRTFFFGTLLGIIPGSFVYVSIGVAVRELIQKPNFTLHAILDPKILFAFIGLGVLSFLPVVYKYFRK